MFYQTAEYFSVEALRIYSANVISFHLASGGLRWFILGFCLDPDNASTIEDVVAAISQRPRGGALLVVRDFNTDLAVPEGRVQGEEIAVAMAESVL